MILLSKRMSNESKTSFVENCQQQCLENWVDWMKRRRQVHGRLKECLSRKPGLLLMNSGDEQRSVLEEKNLFQYAKIVTTFDKYRGNPAYWTLPGTLREASSIFSVLTKEQRNEVPQIEYVAVPRHIAEEKDILPRQRNVFNMWKNAKYRLETLAKIASKLQEIEPHKPELEELVVVGKKIVLRTPSIVKPPVQIKDEKFLHKVEVLSEKSEGIKRICFSVNDVDISNSKERSETSRKIRVLFEHDVKSKEPAQAHIKFENKGMATVRFHFHAHEKFRLFPDVHEDRLEGSSPFYFNKNELIVLPGHTVYVPIWFKSAFPGNYYESWIISSVPKIWFDDFRLFIALQGLEFSHQFEMHEAIKTMIAGRVRNTIIQDVLQEVFANLQYAAVMEVPQSYTEVQVFESANKDVKCPENMPKYIYNRTVVDKLKLFYDEVKQPGHPKTWNYSVGDLKIITRERDIISYVEAKTEQWMKATKRRWELKTLLLEEEEKMKSLIAKSKRRGENKKKLPKKEKTKAKQAALKKSKGELNNEEADTVEDLLVLNETCYGALEVMLEQLERPAITVNRTRRKYLNGFFITRAIFTKMCETLEILDKIMLIPQSKCYSPNLAPPLPDRLIYETFDETCIARNKRITPEERNASNVRPKPEILNGISTDNTEKIFKTYFGTSDTPKKNQSAVKETPLKSARKSSDKKSQKSKILSGPARVKEDFNPFAEDFVQTSLESNTVETQDVPKASINSDILQSYDSKLYQTVYSHLEETVDCLVDMLETLKQEQVSDELFEGLRETTIEDQTCPCENPTNSTKLKIEPKASNQSIAEDKLYFDSLLEIQWRQNANTKKYFVQGRIKESVTFPVVDSSGGSTPEAFEPFVRNVEEYVLSFANAAVQLDATEDDFETFSIPSNKSDSFPDSNASRES